MELVEEQEQEQEQAETLAACPPGQAAYPVPRPYAEYYGRLMTGPRPV